MLEGDWPYTALTSFLQVCRTKLPLTASAIGNYMLEMRTTNRLTVLLGITTDNVIRYFVFGYCCSQEWIL